MKILNKIMGGIIMVSVVLTSCEKEESSANVSKVTNYPTLDLTGDQFMTIAAGGTYNEPGITVTIGGEEVEPEIEGSVDASTPGVYIITYSAANEDGFSASVKRYVGVIDAAAAANDFSGKYQRTKYGTNTTPAGIATWTKVADGLYTNNDIGGVGEATIANTGGYGKSYYIFNVEGNDIVFPIQVNPLGGEVEAVSEGGGERITFDPGPAGTDSYTWRVLGAGYGTNPRTFTKQ